jgi:hypothetical protein
MYETTAKQMYLAYVKNCKFTSPNSWPVINFMRRSLAELFALNQRAAYNYAFVYVRYNFIAARKHCIKQVCAHTVTSSVFKGQKNLCYPVSHNRNSVTHVKKF